MSDPTYLTLEQWDGRNQGRGLMTLPVGIIHVHHSVTSETIGVRPTDDAIADFRRLDAEGLYGGIAYSYAIHPEGVIGEGQALQIGTHTLDWNGFPWDRGTSFGICFVGDFQPREGVDADELTSEAVAAFRFLRDMLLSIGALAPDYILRGHRDAPGDSTACPGDKIENNLATLRESYRPAPIPGPSKENLDMKLTPYGSSYLQYGVDTTGMLLQSTYDKDLKLVEQDKKLLAGNRPSSDVEVLVLADGRILIGTEDVAGHNRAISYRPGSGYFDARGGALALP